MGCRVLNLAVVQKMLPCRSCTDHRCRSDRLNRRCQSKCRRRWPTATTMEWETVLTKPKQMPEGVSLPSARRTAYQARESMRSMRGHETMTKECSSRRREDATGHFQHPDCAQHHKDDKECLHRCQHRFTESSARTVAQHAKGGARGLFAIQERLRPALGESRPWLTAHAPPKNNKSATGEHPNALSSICVLCLQLLILWYLTGACLSDVVRRQMS